MIAADEDALICDFAETYHIYDFRSLPMMYAATLACGLREDSRIKLKLSKQRVSTDTLLMAGAVDALNSLVWMKTKDGRKGRNHPQSIVEKLTEAEKSTDLMSFNSAEEFDKARAALLKAGD